MSLRNWMIAAALATTGLAACNEVEHATASSPPAIAGEEVQVEESRIDATFAAAGTAEPLQQATLSTRLMGSVTEVLVHAGDRVTRGQVLVRIDARDVAAKRAQVSASLAEAGAILRDAEVQAERFRNLHADGAAPKVHLDAAETGLARAQAAVNNARAAGREVDVVAGYGVVRAPFDGVVTRRFVDPGAFAAPGAPLVAVEDASQLRVSVTAPPGLARGLSRGAEVIARIEGVAVKAQVEGVVRAAGNLQTINALVSNADGEHASGSAARLELPTGERRGLLVPLGAVVREGDLTGVHVRVGETSELRWVRLGRPVGERIEVLSGIAAGDRVIVPAQPLAGN